MPFNIRRGDGENTIDIKRTYTVYIDVEEIDPDYDDDEITLKSEDGAYEETLVLGTDGELVDDRWLKITFPRVEPGKRYTCEHDFKRTSTGHTGKATLFKFMSIEQIHLNKPARLDESQIEEGEQQLEDARTGQMRIGDEVQLDEAALDDGVGVGDASAEEPDPLPGLEEKDFEDRDLWMSSEDYDDDGDDGGFAWAPSEDAEEIRKEEEAYDGLEDEDAET